MLETGKRMDFVRDEAGKQSSGREPLKIDRQPTAPQPIKSHICDDEFEFKVSDKMAAIV